MEPPVLSSVRSPLAAYSDDFAGQSAEAIHPAHERSLQVALYLWRAGQVRGADRRRVFADIAEALARTSTGASLNEAADDSPDSSKVESGSGPGDDLSLVFAEIARREAIPEEWANRLTSSVRAAAEELEKAGAFRLAYSLLNGLRTAIDEIPLLELGRVITQQGRIARQLGAFSTAEDHYAVVARLGRRGRLAELRARGLIGHGLVASMRGNYPKARVAFERALRIVHTPELAQLQALAHHGLLSAAVAAKDVESALIHGWHAFRTVDDPDRQAELVIALGEVALLAGHPAAALAAATHALELTHLDRVRLAAFGGAAVACGRLGRRDLLDRLATDAGALIARSNHRFENSYTLLELAESYAAMDERETARRLLAESEAIARRGEYFELVHRAETLSASLEAAEKKAASRRRSTDAWRSATLVEEVHSEHATDESPPLSAESRSVIRSLAALGS